MSNTRQPIYNIGDKVKLNVDGPNMSIKAILGLDTSGNFNGSYRCQWFAGKKLEWGDFSEESLEVIPNLPSLDESTTETESET